jgi:hypothetical protein
MNPNDLVAQQQALLNQALQNTHQLVWVYGVLFLALAIIHFTIVYLFYARLRDIADELRKLRIVYEMAQDRKARAATSAPHRTGDDSRYLPKS